MFDFKQIYTQQELCHDEGYVEDHRILIHVLFHVPADFSWFDQIKAHRAMKDTVGLSKGFFLHFIYHSC